MAIKIQEAFRQFIEAHRVARLATVDRAGHPCVIPVCYVFMEITFYSAIDAKPKRVAPRQLRRFQNIQGNPHVSLLIDDYSENWNELAYMHVRGISQHHGTGWIFGIRASKSCRRPALEVHTVSLHDN